MVKAIGLKKSVSRLCQTKLPDRLKESNIDKEEESEKDGVI